MRLQRWDAERKVEGGTIGQLRDVEFCPRCKWRSFIRAHWCTIYALKSFEKVTATSRLIYVSPWQHLHSLHCKNPAGPTKSVGVMHPRSESQPDMGGHTATGTTRPLRLGVPWWPSG